MRGSFSSSKKKTRKQLTMKQDYSPLHLAARSGNLEMVMEIVSNSEELELKDLLSKQNHSGETALYVAAEFDFVDLVKLLIKYFDVSMASIKAINGYDAFHVASKQGNLEVLKVLMEAIPQLAINVGRSNTTTLHTAATQGHYEVVNFLLDSVCRLASIPRSNGKTPLHSAARNGHLMVVKALLSKEPGIATRIDKKGQTALHMAVKGHNVELVDELVKSDPSLVNMVDAKGNTPLHIATRKGRAEIVQKLLNCKGMNMVAINKLGETAFDTAEKTGHSLIAAILREHGILSANSIKNPDTNKAQELKQTVSDIKHEVHYQLEHTWQTQKHVRGIRKRLNKMHSDGLNNAVNSTTLVAVLIATVTFAAIFTVPGLYPDNPTKVPPGFSPGEAYIAPRIEFIVFIIFDSVALFISLAVVIVQTSLVVIERKLKKTMMAIINKLMWFACLMVSAAFLALSYIVVGDHQRGLAIAVTFVGAMIMIPTLAILCYWVILFRIQVSKWGSIRNSSRISKSQSWSISVMSDSEMLNNEYKPVYAI